MQTYITDYIDKYITLNKSAWHMPGHKRKDDADLFTSEIKNLFKRDFTEVPGLDDYHCPDGIIKSSQEEVAGVYKTYKSYYLVNGSTSGILSALYACVCIDGEALNAKTGSKNRAVIISRNCHKSVFNAIMLLGVKPIYVYPTYIEEGRIYGPVRAEDIKKAISENSEYDICCCIFPSPTYEGVFSDIEGISKLLHENNIKLIVDEAHGAHLPFINKFGESAIYLGADIVIQSLHKTLPSLTQTAIIHVCSNENEDKSEREKIDKALKKYLSVFQSSSPSYIFLQSMEQCVNYCDCNRKKFEDYYKNIILLREKLGGLKNIRLFNPDNCKIDKSRIVLISDKITGSKMSEILEKEYGIVMEMSGVNYITAITSIMDLNEDYNRLLHALCELDERLNDEKVISNENKYKEILINTENGKLPLDETEGLRIRDYIYVYPPGIPLIAPYEKITREMINEVKIQIEAGKTIRF